MNLIKRTVDRAIASAAYEREVRQQAAAQDAADAAHANAIATLESALDYIDTAAENMRGDEPSSGLDGGAYLDTITEAAENARTALDTLKGNPPR